MIVLLKADKPPEEPSSYRPISLLSILAKIFEKVVLSRLQTVIEQHDLLPPFQFGFRSKHSTIEQVHRIFNKARQALENKEFAPAVFLDVSSAFDKVWHQGLLEKLRRYFPATLCQLIQSYLANRSFYIQYRNATSELKQICAGVPQGSVLGPTLYLLYTMDIPQAPATVTGLFADDTAIISSDNDYKTAVETLQTAVSNISQWAQDWKIKLNESKSVRVDFALRPHGYIPTLLDGKPIPVADTARYLGLHLDCKLNRHEHIVRKCKLLDMHFTNFYWLIGRHSTLSLQNKRLIYTAIFKPMWM